MSSIKEQRTRLFQEKLQELGDIGTKERSEDAAPFYDYCCPVKVFLST